MDAITHTLNEIWALVNEMSPYLLLGFLLAGLMHEFIPNTLYKKYLSGKNLKSVVLAALFGVPLPLCSCGVIPTAMSLRREGSSKGATISFLIATPQTGVDSIVATYSLMGLPFAIIRPLVAMITAIFGGVMVNLSEKEKARATQSLEGADDACEGAENEDGDCCHGHEHSHADSNENGHARNLTHRLFESLEYAFLEMMEDIGKWLVIGLIVAGLITALVPDEWFAAFQGNSLLSILFVLLFSIPMYLCATGSIPIAVALMLKGLTPGAALVLLMAGPASNAASIMVINKVMGRKTLVVYLLSIVGGAILFGLGVDWLLPSEWFTSALTATKDCCEEGPGWFSIACTILLILLLINALTPLKVWKGDGCSCCHENESDGCEQKALEGASCSCGNEITVHSQKKVLAIKGMNCNHCATNVQKAIMSVKGVESAEVSLAEKKATVTGDFKMEEVLEAIRSIGFEVEL